MNRAIIESVTRFFCTVCFLLWVIYPVAFIADILHEANSINKILLEGATFIAYVCLSHNPVIVPKSESRQFIPIKVIANPASPGHRMCSRNTLYNHKLRETLLP